MTENMYTIIEQKNWKRAEHCRLYRNNVEPSYCVTFELDITNFLAKTKEKGIPFTMGFIYAVSKCANEIEEFRYRFVDGDIVLFHRINTAFTHLNRETELFKLVSVEMKDTMEEYAAVAKEMAENQKEYFTGPLGNDVFHFSSLPWISYTHVSHTNSGEKDNATPMFNWGKFFKRDGKVLLPFSMQAHHSFVDGIHMGKLADKLQAFLDDFSAKH